MSFIIRFQAADGQPLKIVYYLRVWSMLSGSLMEHLQNSCNYSVSLCTRCYLEARCFKSCARSQHSSLSRRCSDQVAIMGKLKTAFLCYQWAWGHCLLRGCGCCYLCHLTHRNQLWYITPALSSCFSNIVAKSGHIAAANNMILFLQQHTIR